MIHCLLSLLAVEKNSLRRPGEGECGTLGRTMLISMDHDCTPYCPLCISDEDLLKSRTTRKIVPKPMSSKSAAKAAVRLMCMVVAVVALVSCLSYAQVHKSHEAKNGLIGRESSIGLAEKLEVIEYLSRDIRQSSTGLAQRLKRIELLSKDVRFSLAESAHIMAAKKADISASDFPNSGPSLSPKNHNSTPPASASDRKKKSESSFALLDKLLKAVRLNLALGLATVPTAATLLIITLLLIRNQVTTRSFIDRQFSIGSAEELELSVPRRPDVPSQINEAARVLLELSIELAERREVSEPRQADVPSSPTEAAHIMVAHDAGTSATDSSNQTDVSLFLWRPSPPSNGDSPRNEWEFIEREEA